MYKKHGHSPVDDYSKTPVDVIKHMTCRPWRGVSTRDGVQQIIKDNIHELLEKEGFLPAYTGKSDGQRLGMNQGSINFGSGLLARPMQEVLEYAQRQHGAWKKLSKKMDKGSPKETFVLGFECADASGREMLEQVVIQMLGTNGTRDHVWTWDDCEHKGKLWALNQQEGLKGNMIYVVCVKPCNNVLSMRNLNTATPIF